MTDELPQEPVAAEVPRKRRSLVTVLLIVLVALLALSCAACLVGGYFLGRPGEAIPPTHFIDESTRGIIVLRVDATNPGLRQVLAYVGDSAIKHKLAKEEAVRRFVQPLKSGQGNPIPSFTVIASYKGTGAADVRTFGVAVLRELPRWMRIGADRYFRGIASDAKGQPFGNRLIVDGKKMMEALRRKGTDPGSTVRAVLEESQLSFTDSCVFVGRKAADVQAGMEALDAPEPSAQWPFMQLYGRADSTATIYGALSNENDLLLAALVPADRMAEMREKIGTAIFLDPQQVKNVTFSVVFVSDDKATVQLTGEGGNPDVANQIAAGVQAFGASKVEADKQVPLRFAVTSAEVKGSACTATVKVTGLRALIDNLMADLAARKAQSEDASPAAGTQPRK